MLEDKDIQNTLGSLIDVVDSWFVAGLDVPRGADQEILVEHLKQLGADTIQSFPEVVEAYAAAGQDKQAQTIVCGSFYTVAEVMQCL